MKICQVIFSTNRINYLKRTLNSQKNFLDFSGVSLVNKIFIDDFPHGRDNQYITDLVKQHEFTEIVLHTENLGISSTWQEVFDLVKSRDYDYILHTEDDVELLMPIKVLDLVQLLESDPTLSQVNLKRNAWYNTEKADPLLTTEDKKYKNFLYEKTNKYFWSLFSVYPKRITEIDYRAEYGSCANESTIAEAVKNKYNLYSALLKTEIGSAIVEHIGDYTKGKRLNDSEPGAYLFKHYNPKKLYDSKTGEEIMDQNKKYRTSLIVIDNFYTDPDSIRNYALSLDFSVTGNWPGSRTVPYLPQFLKDKFQEIILPHGGKITNWYEETGLSGAFQLTYSSQKSWIHSDNHNTWAAVCYLNPDAPIAGGTGLFKHKDSGSYLWQEQDNPETFDGQDKTKWELVDSIGNIYNRLIIYKGNLFHTSLEYFGNTKDTGRLFQVFFFNTQFQ